MIDSRCGLHCTDCKWKESHGCGGCIKTMGHPFYGECQIAICCQDKGLVHCGECDIVPCEKLYAYSYLDQDHGDKPPGTRVAVCRRWATESGKQIWGNVLLTSAGFEDINHNQRLNLVNRFLEMLGRPAGDSTVLLVTTAAIDSVSKEMVTWCKNELVSMGFLSKNITTYDIDGSLSIDEALNYDAIYFTGGDTNHLLRRIRETQFDSIIKKLVYANKVYVGVSAGSIIATPSIGNSLNEETAGLALVNAYISVHQPEGKPTRKDLDLPHIPLADNQAIVVSCNGYDIIEG